MADPVEFLADPDDAGRRGPDGPEPHPDAAAPPPRSAWTGRRSVLLRGASAAVLLVALTAWIATRPSGPDRRPAAAPTRTVTPSASTPVPGAVACRVGAPLDIDIVRAMRHALPTIVIDNAATYRCTRGRGATGRIVAENITGRVGDRLVRVVLTVRGPNGRGVTASSGVGGPGSVLLGSVNAEGAGLTVLVETYGRSGSRVPLRAMGLLADDLSLNIVL